MRHPLIGDEMTVALNDFVILRDLLGFVDDFKDWKQIQKALVALYDLFGANRRFY